MDIPEDKLKEILEIVMQRYPNVSKYIEIRLILADIIEERDDLGTRKMQKILKSRHGIDTNSKSLYYILKELGYYDEEREHSKESVEQDMFFTNMRL